MCIIRKMWLVDWLGQYHQIQTSGPQNTWSCCTNSRAACSRALRFNLPAVLQGSDVTKRTPPCSCLYIGRRAATWATSWSASSELAWIQICILIHFLYDLFYKRNNLKIENGLQIFWQVNRKVAFLFYFSFLLKACLRFKCV